MICSRQGTSGKPLLLTMVPISLMLQLLRALQDAVSDAVDGVGDVRDGSVVCGHAQGSPSVVTRLLHLSSQQ